MADSLIKNKHLLWRAGFGIGINQISELKNKSNKTLIGELFKEDQFTEISYDTPDVDPTTDDMNANTPAERKKEMQRINREQNNELNLNFLNQMVNGKEQIREKMAFFWHGHFASRVINPKFNKQLLNTIRKNALGSFKDLLFEVSQSPAMLNFLNNQQNKKDHPNENFAREVMELFTMGRGNYTEKDVREGARAFTGWSYDKEGNFKERKNLHDEGVKNFLGRTGNFNGEDILNSILEQKATSQFITTKIYKFFVNENVDHEIVNRLSTNFYNSGYNIKKLLTEIFSSSWFYDEKNIGNRIKSPVELMVGIMRILPMQIQNPENLIVYQKLLGQMLLYPPNVSGWPSGKSWIDSSTLMLRLQVPQIWSGLRPLEYSPRQDDDIDMGMKSRETALNKSFKNPNITIDWNRVDTIFAQKNCEDYILQKTKSLDINTVKNFSDKSIKMTVINLMSTPEYQLC
ncbi:DUF1800 domain-containing protein [Chryseobacterium indologenes]|uniref:DUF1800 domain-containing protein n=1 Tax=Chryseobacterium indologenes TaxID=253 RepID=UPI0003E0638C|nr:DUF1800 domain-containing protein [Chryseobacterium indologenes]ASE60248.1 DUF1800 domain-containing protein [Chryseobacterium indologenes]SFJ29707.1 Uncharacterized conserved protein, DUF1800 family [Chryseobacterium indologenes]SUX53262.1 Protein of uncharacterised function (DUF1800) [Chryseobacterium indologenes]VFA44332.1 Protein of uncharacterised function (DUF1800) [Chryseobacterium indologenes]GAE63054.1 hypothetical protein CIN01S_02_01770 [Chryseobacterium indologenes NBRC 14944]